MTIIEYHSRDLRRAFTLAGRLAGRVHPVHGFGFVTLRLLAGGGLQFTATDRYLIARTVVMPAEAGSHVRPAAVGTILTVPAAELIRQARALPVRAFVAASLSTKLIRVAHAGASVRVSAMPAAWDNPTAAAGLDKTASWWFDCSRSTAAMVAPAVASEYLADVAAWIPGRVTIEALQPRSVWDGARPAGAERRPLRFTSEDGLTALTVNLAPAL